MSRGKTRTRRQDTLTKSKKERYMTTDVQLSNVNGINTEALRSTVEAVTQDPSKGATHWQVTSHWRGGTRSDARVTSYEIGGQRIAKDFTIRVDEPLELCGTNEFANPQ